MGWLRLLRLTVLYSITLLSLVTLVLSSYLLHLRLPSNTHTITSFMASILDVVTFPTIFLLDHLQSGTHATPIIIEVLWSVVSGILWLIVVGTTATALREHAGVCFTPASICAGAVQASEGLSVTIAVILIAYAGMITVKSSRASRDASGKRSSVWMGTVSKTLSASKPKTILRSSYNPSVLDIFAIKEEDDPFQRTPSIRGSIPPAFLPEIHFTPSTPMSASLLHSPVSPSPLIRSPTPMYLGTLNTA